MTAPIKYPHIQKHIYMRIEICMYVCINIYVYMKLTYC